MIYLKSPKYFFKLFLLPTVFCFSILTVCFGQSDFSNALFPNENISLGLGVGAQYSVLGPAINIRIAPGLHSTNSASYVKSRVLWTTGVEYRFRKSWKRLLPFIFTTYGKNIFSTLIDQQSRESESKLFYSLNIGSGIKLKLNKKWNGHLSIGISLQSIRKSKLEEFVNDFNQRRNLNITASNHIRMYVSIGYNFRLK